MTADHWCFNIEGLRLCGYRASLAGHDTQYGRYKRYVRLRANLAGVPDTISPGDRYSVSCDIYWRKAARLDWSIGVKAVEDALFKQDRGLVPGEYGWHEASGVEMIVVQVRRVMP